VRRPRGHAPFVLADPGAVPPTLRAGAVEPLPLMSREPVLVEHLMEVGELTLTVTGVRVLSWSRLSQVLQHRSGGRRGRTPPRGVPVCSCRERTRFSEDQVKPAVRCERAGNRDPSRRAQEPIVLPLHRRIRRVVGGVFAPRGASEELADDTGPRIGKTRSGRQRATRALSGELPRPEGRGFLLHSPPYRERVHQAQRWRSTPDTPTRF